MAVHGLNIMSMCLFGSVVDVGSRAGSRLLLTLRIDGVAPVLSLSMSYCCCLTWTVAFPRSLMCFINGSILEYPVAILMVSTDIVIFRGSAEFTLSMQQRIGVFVHIDAGRVLSLRIFWKAFY